MNRLGIGRGRAFRLRLGGRDSCTPCFRRWNLVSEAAGRSTRQTSRSNTRQGRGREGLGVGFSEPKSRGRASSGGSRSAGRGHGGRGAGRVCYQWLDHGFRDYGDQCRFEHTGSRGSHQSYLGFSSVFEVGSMPLWRADILNL